MLSFACIYELYPKWDCLFSEAIRPNTLLRIIVSQASLGTGLVVYKKETIESLLDVYEAISGLDHLIHSDPDMITPEVDRILSFAKVNVTIDFIEDDLQHEPMERVNACCQLACQAFWKTVRSRRRYQQIQSSDEMPEVQMILKHILQLEPIYWIRNAPEIFTWITFTGAAASTTEKDRVAFVSHAGTILTAIDAESLTLARQGFRYFCLLRKLSGHDEPSSVLDKKLYRLKKE
jgi:hypothetical protein